MIHEISNSLDWEEVFQQFEFGPLGQVTSWASSSHVRHHEVLRFSSSQKGLIACQGVLKDNLLYPRYVIEDGPLISDSAGALDFKNFFSGLRQLLPSRCAIELSSVILYSPETELFLRSCGFKRPLVTINSPLSVYLRLNEIKPTRNWQRNYQRSLRFDPTFEIASANDHTVVGDCMRIYTEMTKLKRIGPSFDAFFVSELIKNQAIKVFFARNYGKRESVRIVFTRNRIAFDILGATTAVGRKMYSSYFVVRNALRTLEALGVEAFDFGRIGAGRHLATSNFKRGLGGSTVTYLGEWVAGSNSYKEGTFSLLRLLSRRERW